MSGLFGWISPSQFQGPPNDDWIDRVNHLWSVFVLVLFAIFVTSTQFAGEPIHCWAPAEFSGPWVQYTNSICWVSNTYHIPIQDRIPVDISERKSQEVPYYQWVSIILLLMAFMFKLPNMLWNILNDSSGINVDKIVTMSEAAQLGSGEDRERSVTHIASYIDRWLETNRESKQNAVNRMRLSISKYCIFFCDKKDGTFLTGLYMFIKVLYCANGIGQFFLLNSFLAMEYNFYGIEVMNYLHQNGSLRESPRFPRVTLCDFEIRQMQNLLRYTVQCVLSVNLFNEKIFIFVWFWLVVVSAVTIVSLLFWIWRVSFQQNKIRYCKRYLRTSDLLQTAHDRKLYRMFSEQYLRADGIFVLRLVTKNSTDLVTSDLLEELWYMYKNKHYNKSSDLDLPDGGKVA